MRINIAQRLRPYSHQPGVYVVLPYSDIRLQIFPALLRLYRLDKSEPTPFAEFPLLIEGVIHPSFTVCQDLEAGCVYVWGQSHAGFRRLRIEATQEGSVRLTCERGQVAIQLPSGIQPLATKESIMLLAAGAAVVRSVAGDSERLSLGSHRTQECERWRTHLDLQTILPIWLRLGRWIPQPQHPLLEGTAQLLSQVSETPRERLAQLFQQLLLVGFEGLLSPRLIDTDYQGFVLSPPSRDTSPLVLLSEGSRRIRSLLIQQQGCCLTLLPSLPTEFHCGRMTGVDCEGVGSLDLEWSKKQLRRLVLTPQADSEWQFDCQRELRRFRIRRTMNERGTIHACHTPLLLPGGIPTYFDRFEK